MHLVPSHMPLFEAHMGKLFGSLFERGALCEGIQEQIANHPRYRAHPLLGKHDDSTRCLEIYLTRKRVTVSYLLGLVEDYLNDRYARDINEMPVCAIHRRDALEAMSLANKLKSVHLDEWQSRSGDQLRQMLADSIAKERSNQISKPVHARL